MPNDASSFAKRYFFLDESGDPTFYAKRKKLLVGTEGFQPLLLIGMISLKDKAAIRKAVKQDNHRRQIPINIRFNCEIVRSQDTPEMSIVDYMLWALQRYIPRGDGRFYKALIDKYSLISDLYDFETSEGSRPKEYNHQNPFNLKKASEFRGDGYI